MSELPLLQHELLEVNDNVQGEQISIESDSRMVVFCFTQVGKIRHFYIDISADVLHKRHSTPLEC